MAQLTQVIYPSYPKQAPMPSLEVLSLLPSDLVSELRVFPFERTPAGIKIAALNPEDEVMRQFIAGRFGYQVEWYQAQAEDLETVVKHYHPDFSAQILQLVSLPDRSNNNIAQIVDLIIRFAQTKNASDIHLEPFKNQTQIRLRVDGILHKVLELPKNIHEAILARLKIMADLKIDEYRRPQDGRIAVTDNLSFRISIVPALHGEKVVMRILDDVSRNLTLDNLGFSNTQKQILIRNIEKPFGMIVSSGTTGSGKTTTLYGLLELLKKNDINISTLEDPVEYSIAGVNQVQVNPKFGVSFTSGLRAMLRQDPDVLLVGEIRDSETAAIAADAALTGHLVLTTIHTNDAPSTFNRFLEMGVEDFLVGSVVNLIIAQRLVRKVCLNCAVPTTLNQAVVEKIKQRGDVARALHERGCDLEQLHNKTFMIGKGCDACLNTGYQGRIGLFELLELNPKIHDLILKRAPAQQIRLAGEENGFKNLINDGLDKVFAGITTFDEVLRSTRNSQE